MKIEFDSEDKCVKCGALRPLFKTHCQTESCKELRRQPKKTIKQQKCIKCNRKDKPDQFLNGLCPRCDDEKEFIPEDF